MPCCLSCFEEDREILEIKYKTLSKKYETMFNKVLELNVIIEELRHNNNILSNEYDRLKNEYNEFFKTYYDEILKCPKTEKSINDRIQKRATF